MPEFNIKEFKDGVSDGLLNGTRDDSKRTPGYKEGYDFGITLYCQQEEMEEHRRINEFESISITQVSADVEDVIDSFTEVLDKFGIDVSHDEDKAKELEVDTFLTLEHKENKNELE
tara:strand:+ start:802 stop:1149 length:348 start_codon:yes stop_codon:yes gene_type:complete